MCKRKLETYNEMIDRLERRSWLLIGIAIILPFVPLVLISLLEF